MQSYHHIIYLTILNGAPNNWCNYLEQTPYLAKCAHCLEIITLLRSGSNMHEHDMVG